MLKVRANQRTEKALKTGCSSPSSCSGHRHRQKALGDEAAVEKEELGKGRMTGSKRLITWVEHGAICSASCRQVVKIRAYEPTPWGNQSTTGCSLCCFNIICDLTGVDFKHPLVIAFFKEEKFWSTEMSS